jgi:molecular chaperone GrpE
VCVMEENEKNKTKPLRSAPNKLRDLYNTYLKNEEINSDESVKQEIKEQLKSEVESEDDTVEAKKVTMLEEDELVEILRLFEQLEGERDELKEKLARRTAELENVRRRSIKEKQEMIDYANEKLLYKMLSIVDDMSNALKAGKDSKDYDALYQGVEMIAGKTMKLFEEAGVKSMEDPVGKPFDVDFHDALMQMPSEFPEGDVVQEVQKGYMIRDKVLRHAKVVTSSGMPPVTEE